MSKEVTYKIKVTVSKDTDRYNSSHYKVTAEGSGFSGQAEGIFLGQTFEKAYEDLMAKVSEAIFKDDP